MKMKTRKLKPFFLSLLIICTLAVLPWQIRLAEATPAVTVANVHCSDATAMYYQDQLLYAQGRYWAAYANYLGNPIKYRTSTDGAAWSSEASITLGSTGSTCDARQFSWTYDGIYLAYVYQKDDGSDYFRMGVPNSDGTVNWLATEQRINTVNHGIGTPSAPTIVLNSTHNAYVSTTDYTLGTYLYVNSLANGGWANATGTPVQIVNDYHACQLVTLSNGNVYAAYESPLGTVKGRLYNGTLQAAETIDISTTEMGISIVADGNNVHAAYLKKIDTTCYSKYRRRTFSVGWGNNATIDTLSEGYMTALTYDSTNSIYAVYGMGSELRYNHYNGTAWTGRVVWESVSPSIVYGYGTISYRKTYNHEIAALYNTGASPNWYVKFSKLYVGVNLNLRTKDWNGGIIEGATVYANETTKTSDSNGWANFTNYDLNAIVEVKVKFQSVWVNSTTVTMDSSKTIDVKCKVWNLTINAKDNGGTLLTQSATNITFTYSNNTSTVHNTTTGTATFKVMNGTSYYRIKYQGLWISANTTLPLTDPDQSSNQTINKNCWVYSLTAYVTSSIGVEMSGATLTLTRGDYANLTDYGLTPKTAEYYNSTHARYVWTQLANQTASYTVFATSGTQTASQETSLTANKAITLTIPTFVTSPPSGPGGPSGTTPPPEEQPPYVAPVETPTVPGAEFNTGIMVLLGVVISAVVVAAVFAKPKRSLQSWQIDEKIRRKWRKKTRSKYRRD